MSQPSHGEEQPHVVVRDRRRIDPQTGQIRQSKPELDEELPASLVETEGGEPVVPEAEIVTVDDPAAEFKDQLEERTADLQRLTAEYANYRKRVERDRELVITTAKAQVAAELLGVLDDIERAVAHDDLTGAFRAVAEKLVSALQQVGLEPFGHEGEPFDPSIHEAVQHSTSPDVAGPTVTAVLRRGYRFGERALRSALVAVTDFEATAKEPPVDVVNEPGQD